MERKESNGRRRARSQAKPSLETVGGRILSARLEEGMGQEELASLVHVTSRSIIEWENDRVVPYRWIKALSEVLNKPMGWILHGEEAPLETGIVESLLRDILEELRRMNSNGSSGSPPKPT